MIKTLIRAMGLASTVVLAAAAPALATTHYAATNGKSIYWPCTSPSAPCDLITAIQGVKGVGSPSVGDEVVIEPGTYQYWDTPIYEGAADMSIHGASGEPPPQIDGTITQPGPNNEPQTVLTLGLGSRLTHVDITVINQEDLGDTAVRSSGGTLYDDDVFSAVGPYANAVLMQGNDELKDSVASQNGGDSGVAVGIDGAHNAILRNVTAAAYGSGSDAIVSSKDCSSSPDIVSIRNTIALAPSGSTVVADDKYASIDCPPGSSDAIYYQVGYSDFNPNQASLAAGSGIVSDGGNINQQPLFVNPPATNFREVAGSPTIDAGTNDPGDGLFDPDGRWRFLGTAPDIGAYEFPAPYAETDAATGVSATGATLKGVLDPEGSELETKYFFRYGTTTQYGTTVAYRSVPAANTPIPDPEGVSEPLNGLAPSTSYDFQLVATNSDGTTYGSNQTFTTPPAATPKARLSISFAGNGSGDVSTSTGLFCGSQCSQMLPEGSSYTLYAVPGQSSKFAGWSGGGCGTSSTCTVSLNGDTTVTATFIVAPTAFLGVTFPGTGAGAVSDGANETCHTPCAFALPEGRSYTLTATPDPGSTFAGWGGACSGTGDCTVPLNGNIEVSARFNKAVGPKHPHTPALSKFGLAPLPHHHLELKFAVTAGAHKVRSLRITLPNDLVFLTAKQRIVVGSGRARSTLRHGALTVVLGHPASRVMITIQAAFRPKHPKHLQPALVVSVTDTAGHTTRLVQET
jgi:Divergent InlB B-repeat domain